MAAARSHRLLLAAVAAPVLCTALYVAGEAPSGSPAVMQRAHAAPARAAKVHAPADPPPEPVPTGVLAEPAFCGMELPAAPEVTRPMPCHIPALPCGPVPASKIGAAGAEPSEDLDGDGQPDSVLAGIRIGAGAYAYGVIYRHTPLGMVLSDFQRVELPADPAVASVAQGMPRGAPLLRDGHDVPLQGGRTLSVGRLRRWDGQRFRTLLTFCAHRQEPAGPGDRPARQGNNRVTFPDVDGDGTPEVVIAGTLRPVVLRVVGAALREDAELTRRYRDNAPEERKARALRAEAEQSYQRGEWRKAAGLLRQARDLTPHVADLRERLAAVLQRLGEQPAALDELRQAVALQPERPSAQCALAEALRVADDDDELGALRQCLTLGAAGDPARRATLEARLRALEIEQRPDGGVRDGGAP